MCRGRDRKKPACSALHRINFQTRRTITQARLPTRNNPILDQQEERSLKLRFFIEVMFGCCIVLAVHAWLLFIVYLFYAIQK